MSGKKKQNLDPLFEMFEHSLATKSYEDSSAFTKQLAEQYLAYIDSTPAHIPLSHRASVIEDLESEAHEMLVKKMYGCVKPAEYMNYGRVMQIRKDVEISALEFSTQATDEAKAKPQSKR
jgi:hypothetical protein